MSNEVDRVMKDRWLMTSLQEYLKALCFYFIRVMTALLCQLQFACFLLRKTPHHYWNNSYLNKKDFMIPDLTSRPIQKTQTLFCTDSSLGMAEAGTLKLDLRAFKSTITIYKNPVGHIDTSSHHWCPSYCQVSALMLCPKWTRFKGFQREVISFHFKSPGHSHDYCHGVTRVAQAPCALSTWHDMTEFVWE